MNHLQTIDFKEFRSDIFSLFADQWFLLSAGSVTDGAFNTMTVSWGFMGTMWGKPMVISMVRPQRYTMEYLDNYDSFTLCGFGAEQRAALGLLGRLSGRDSDKITQSGLTPIPAAKVDAPAFAEAELVIECRKQALSHLKGPDFLNKKLIREFYPERDFHKMVFGEVVRISGTDAYKK